MSTDFIAWTDPYAWTERLTMRTKRAIQKENALFKTIVSESGSKEKLGKKESEFQDVIDEYKNMEIFRAPSTGDPKILMKLDEIQEGVIHWKYAKNGAWKYTTGMDISDDGLYTVAYTVESPEPYDYKLHVKTPTSKWSHSHGGGPFVAIKGPKVYYLEEDKHLQYIRLISLSLSTGKERKIIYEETNPSMELTMLKLESRALFLMKEDAGVQQVAIIEGNECRWLNKKAICFFPVGYQSLVLEEPIYFARIGSFDAGWTLFGIKWILNDEIKMAGLEFCSSNLAILVTKTYGVRTIWRMSVSVKPKKLYSDIFYTLPYTRLPFWRGEVDALHPLWVRDPCYGEYKIVCTPTYVYVQRPKIPYAKKVVGESISSDGIPVRWMMLDNKAETKTKPKGLMLVVYGAYGLPTSLNTIRWIPWIRAGWAVAILFVRGGGDGNEMWADIGRLSGKQQAVLDTEACCKDLQRLTGCGPDNTCMYGRSAGGIIIGNLVSQNPSGKLFEMVYAEVPYVDILKTASNANLPLTAYEYHEFGNPTKGPVEFEQTMAISPIHNLGPEGAPGVKVLCRSGSTDIQVYYYESLKWIYALRGGRPDDEKKILHISKQGHHTTGKELSTSLAEDLLIIEKWLSKSNTK